MQEIDEGAQFVKLTDLINQRSFTPTSSSSSAFSSPFITNHRLWNHCLSSITHSLSLWSFSHKLERQRTIGNSGSEANLLRGRQDFDGGTKEQYFYWFISDCIFNSQDHKHFGGALIGRSPKTKANPCHWHECRDPRSPHHTDWATDSCTEPRDPSSYIEELGFVQRFYISGPQRVI